MLLAADDIKGELAELYGYVNRAFPDAELNPVEPGRDKLTVTITGRFVLTSERGSGSIHANVARRVFCIAFTVSRPCRPFTERQRADRPNGRLEALLDNRQLPRGLAVLDPVDQDIEHVDVGGSASADMIGPGSGIESHELARGVRAHPCLHRLEIADSGVRTLGVVRHVFEHDQLAAMRPEGG